MANQYAAKHLSAIDERFFVESVTSEIINKGMRMEFDGVKTVTIYNVDTVAEGDYTRSGLARFGTAAELGTGEETFTLSQDKAATWVVDRGNLNDQMMVTEANKSMKRQIREVAIPATDTYRLTTLQAYAVANTQSVTAGLTNTNAYQSFLTAVDAVFERTGNTDDLVCYLTGTTHNLLKRDPEFVRDCDKSYADLKKGVIGMVDGVKLVKVKSSYLPANTGFLVLSTKVLVSPTKMRLARVLTDQAGVDGAICEYRRYYDAFIPENKGVAIQAHMTA